MKLPLSVVILTKNESQRVGRAVKSVASFCGELIVIDSQSVDGTLECVQKSWRELNRSPEDLIVRVQTWKGFTATRNESIQLARFEWVLWLDADEWVGENFGEELRLLLERSKGTIVNFCRRSFYRGKFIRFGGWYPDRKRRLGQRKSIFWKTQADGSDVHEDLFTIGAENDSITQAPENVCLHHEPFLNLEEHQETNKRYAQLLAVGRAQKRIAQGLGAVSEFYIAIKFCVKFIENFVFKLGFLDGIPGWIIARESSISMKWRLEEMNRIIRQNRDANVSKTR
jgi:glycosyltransferase involved in cell wall biosynthesis